MAHCLLIERTVPGKLLRETEETRGMVGAIGPSLDAFHEAGHSRHGDNCRDDLHCVEGKQSADQDAGTARAAVFVNSRPPDWSLPVGFRELRLSFDCGGAVSCVLLVVPYLLNKLPFKPTP